MKALRKIFSLFIILTLVCGFSFAADKKNSKNTKSEVRIVTLGPAATEIVFAIGAQDQLVARTDLCDYPADVSKYPSVGGFAGNTISLEAIISYEPTLVYLFAGMHDYLVQPLKDAGIEAYLNQCGRFLQCPGAKAVRTIVPIMYEISASPAIRNRMKTNPFRRAAAPKPLTVEQVRR